MDELLRIHSVCCVFVVDTATAHCLGETVVACHAEEEVRTTKECCDEAAYYELVVEPKEAVSILDRPQVLE
jgi:hypothetical protein